MRFPGNVVTLRDTRSQNGGVGTPEKCFYCAGKINDAHDADCVCIQRPVKIRVTMELVCAYPRHWDKEMIEFNLNESSWCASNLIDDLQRRFGNGTQNRCLCAVAEFEYVGEANIHEAEDHGLKADTEDE